MHQFDDSNPSILQVLDVFSPQLAAETIIHSLKFENCSHQALSAIYTDAWLPRPAPVRPVFPLFTHAHSHR